MKKWTRLFCLSAIFVGVNTFAAEVVTVQMFKTTSSGQGASVGTITFEDGKAGLMINPNLNGMPPGVHGFHFHQNPSCNNLGEDAGDHLDPASTHKHLGPYRSQGHLGDLPVLIILNDGQNHKSLVAPRLKLADIKNHAVIIHEGEDNYADKPKKAGGGGARFACGVVK
jgi:Cu-Zn family superoxide dismutase